MLPEDGPDGVDRLRNRAGRVLEHAVGGGEDPLGRHQTAAAELPLPLGADDGRHPRVLVHLDTAVRLALILLRIPHSPPQSRYRLRSSIPFS